MDGIGSQSPEIESERSVLEFGLYPVFDIFFCHLAFVAAQGSEIFVPVGCGVFDAGGQVLS